jgi:ABC-type phosphate/phosphonate transport system ATPase subunit
MIQVIYGKRGSGKSKKMVALANEQVKATKGNVVFVDDDSRAIHELDREIRFIDAAEYALTDYRSIYGFLCGITATNYDVTTIFVDGLFNGMDKKSETSEKIFEKLQEFSETNSIDLYIAMHDEGDLAISELEKYKVLS